MAHEQKHGASSADLAKFWIKSDAIDWFGLWHRFGLRGMRSDLGFDALLRAGDGRSIGEPIKAERIDHNRPLDGRSVPWTSSKQGRSDELGAGF